MSTGTSYKAYKTLTQPKGKYESPEGTVYKASYTSYKHTQHTHRAFSPVLVDVVIVFVGIVNTCNEFLSFVDIHSSSTKTRLI